MSDLKNQSAKVERDERSNSEDNEYKNPDNQDYGEFIE